MMKLYKGRRKVWKFDLFQGCFTWEVLSNPCITFMQFFPIDTISSKLLYNILKYVEQPRGKPSPDFT